MTEVDSAPPPNTFRRFVWETVRGIPFMRGFWGRRLFGGAFGLVADTMGEAVSQSIYARMPGHPEQAPDSLVQSSLDRTLVRFRGETDANWLARVRGAWDDFQQGGTPQQLLHVVNQWGNAGWPLSWPSGTITLVESVDPAVFTSTLTIQFGMIDPPWAPWKIGDAGVTIGQLGLFIGAMSTDIPMLLYVVRKWKRSSGRVYVKAYYTVTDSITFTV